MGILLGLLHALCDQFVRRLLDLGNWRYAGLEDFYRNSIEFEDSNEEMQDAGLEDFYRNSIEFEDKNEEMQEDEDALEKQGDELI